MTSKTISLKSFFFLVTFACVLMCLARFDGPYAFCGAALGGSLWGAVICFQRSPTNDFLTTVFGGAAGGLLGFTALFAVIVISVLLSEWIVKAPSSPGEEQYIGWFEGALLVIFFYGGGSFLAGGCVGIAGWLYLHAVKVGRLQEGGQP